MSKLLPGGGKPKKPKRGGGTTNPFPNPNWPPQPTNPALHPNVGGKAPSSHTSTSSYKKRT